MSFAFLKVVCFPSYVHRDDFCATPFLHTSAELLKRSFSLTKNLNLISNSHLFSDGLPIYTFSKSLKVFPMDITHSDKMSEKRLKTNRKLLNKMKTVERK